MKFLVVGLGSMGKRRIRNLITLGHCEIIGFDIRKDRLQETKKKYNITTVDNFQEGLDKNPDMVIISTSPDYHLHYVKKLVKDKIPFFTEVNTEIKHIEKILDLQKKFNIRGISSMTMKFHPAIKKILDSKKLGKILLLTYHSGENLEDWHPWESVQDYYVGDIKTGVGRDQVVFELEWILWLFGKPIEITAQTAKLSNTKAKIFDTYQMNLKLKNVPIANVLVDVIQRPPNRILRIVFENGLITWDWISGKVRTYHTKTKKWDELSYVEGYKGFNLEEMYKDELKYSIKSIKEKNNYVSTFESELITAKTVIMAEQSSKKQRSLKF